MNIRNNFRRVLCLFLTLLFLLPCVCAQQSTPSDTALPTLSAEGEVALIYNVETGRILWSQGESESIAPASFVKIMTAVLGFEHLALNGDQPHTVSAYTVNKASGTRIGLKEGETILFSELLYGLVVGSANDAALAIAEAVAGSEAEFIALMNQKAAQLGMEHSYFSNPTGMDQSAMTSTLADMAKLCAYAYKINDFMVMTGVVDHTIPATNLSKKRELHTKNQLVDPNPYTGYYTREAMGMNAGSTTKAGFCLATATEHNGLTYLILIARGKYQNNIYSSFADGKALIRYAIDGYELVPVVLKDTAITEMKVELGKDSDTVMLVSEAEVSALLPVNYNRDNLQLKYDYSHSSLTAPVNKGVIVGSVEIYYQGQLLGKTNIVTQRGIELSNVDSFWREVGNFFQLPLVKTVLLISILLLALFVLAFGIILILSRRRKTEKERQAIREYLEDDKDDLKKYRKEYWENRKIKKAERQEALRKFQKAMRRRKNERERKAKQASQRPSTPPKPKAPPSPPSPPSPPPPPPRRGDEYYRK